MSKVAEAAEAGVVEADKLLIYQDHLYKLFHDLRTTSKRQKVLKVAQERSLAAEDILSFVGEMRTEYRLSEVQKVEGIVAAMESAARGSSDQESLPHRNIMTLVHDLMASAQSVTETNKQLAQALTDKYQLGLSNIFGWLPERNHQAFLDDIKKNAPTMPLEDIILQNLLRFQGELGGTFKVPETPNPDKANTALEIYAGKAPRNPAQAPDQPDEPLAAPSAAAPAVSAFKIQKHFASLQAAYDALQTAQRELTAAEVNFAKSNNAMKKIAQAVATKNAIDIKRSGDLTQKDRETRSNIIKELQEGKDFREAQSHRAAANTLQIKAQEVADIIGSEVIQEDIDARSKKGWIETFTAAAKGNRPPPLDTLEATKKKAEGDISKVQTFNRTLADVQNSIEGAEYGDAFSKLSKLLKPSEVADIMKQSKGSLKEASHEMMTRIIRGGEQVKPQQQLTEKARAAEAIITLLSGFSPEAQKAILTQTIKRTHEALEAPEDQRNIDFITLVQGLREDCKTNSEYESVMQARNSAPDPQDGALIPGISRESVMQMCDELEPLFQANFDLAQRKIDIENSKLHLTLEDAPKIALFMAKQIASGTYHNPVVRSAFFSAAGGLIGAAPAALGIGGAAKETFEMSAAISSKVAALTKEGKDMQSAALIAGADVGFDFALAKGGIALNEAAKAEFMQGINDLVAELNNPQRIQAIEAEVKAEVEAASSKEVVVSAAAGSPASKSKDDKTTIVSNLVAERLLGSLLGNAGQHFGLPEKAVNMIKDKLKSPVAGMIDKAGKKARGVVKEKLTPKEAETAVASKAQENQELIPDAVRKITDNLNRAFDAVIASQVAPRPMPLRSAFAAAAVAGGLQAAVDLGSLSPKNARAAADAAANFLHSGSEHDASSSASSSLSIEAQSSAASPSPIISEPPSPPISPRHRSSSSDVSAPHGIKVEVLDEASAVASSARSSISAASSPATSPRSRKLSTEPGRS